MRFEVLRISDRLAQWDFAFLHVMFSGRLDSADTLDISTLFLFCLTPYPTSRHFPTSLKQTFKKAEPFDFPGVIFLRWQTNQSQDRLLNTKKLDQDQETEHF